MWVWTGGRFGGGISASPNNGEMMGNEQQQRRAAAALADLAAMVRPSQNNNEPRCLLPAEEPSHEQAERGEQDVCACAMGCV